MGWTFTKKPDNICQFFKDEYEQSGKYKMLDSEVYKNKEFYGALKNLETGEVFAIVNIMEKGTEKNFEFGYKEMDETAHPYYYNCPQRIFNLLTPTTYESAHAWRSKVAQKLRLAKPIKTFFKKTQPTGQPEVQTQLF